jgi:hypothetical protein
MAFAGEPGDRADRELASHATRMRNAAGQIYLAALKAFDLIRKSAPGVTANVNEMCGDHRPVESRRHRFKDDVVSHQGILPTEGGDGEAGMPNKSTRKPLSRAFGVRIISVDILPQEATIQPRVADS